MVNTTSWIVFLAIAAAGYWYYSQNSKGGARNRGRSLSRQNNVATGRGDTKWLDSEKTKAAPKAVKKKATQAQKTAKKAVQDTAEKVASYTSGASTTGAEADDDLSSSGSPTIAANIASHLPSGKDVSDMLEPKAAAANVMRILPSNQPAKQNKQQQKRPETPQETKKQRQNRRKAEEAKAQREEEEKARKALEEKQRRTAREARGEPAKNGLQPSKAPASNAWASERPAAEAIAPSPQNGQLLDTFEPETSAPVQKKQEDFTNGLSEQEQMRMAMEDSAWETVPKGKKQKKAKAPESTTSNEGKVFVAPLEFAPVNQVPAAKVENKIPQPRYEALEALPDVKHPLDSEWGVV